MRQKMNMCAICHEGSKSSETTDLLSFLMGHSLSAKPQRLAGSCGLPVLQTNQWVSQGHCARHKAF